MNPNTPHGPNRDAGARLYENLPSLTDHGWAGTGRADDSFGPPEIGGPQEPRYDLRQEEDRAIKRSTHRAMHARRGTKNATRSDLLIAEELNERLRDDELVDASEILVTVDEGRVVLAGDVPTRWMKHRAEDIADAIRGVVHVENRIHVDNGIASFGPGGAVRSGLNQPGSGFSSSPPNEDWQPRDSRVD
ncbi:BON domain-containing protein [Cognatilysobacter terrigena]|uniref:BON domain-containing protein n=1 Tax=Cognatilysobacter terrigena TaxID=2488749 RepID=UPI0010605B68|nr:BON domain-containing protein [Lysobacter terrigena]